MLMRRNKPFTAFDRLFDEMFSLPTERYTLALDVVEHEKEYVVTTPIAGVSPEHIEVKLDDDVLTISAEVQEETNQENARTLIKERRYGKFSRSLRFGLPVDGDNIQADYENGVLKVSVPKAEASQPKRIAIKTSR